MKVCHATKLTRMSILSLKSLDSLTSCSCYIVDITNILMNRVNSRLSHVRVTMVHKSIKYYFCTIINSNFPKAELKLHWTFPNMSQLTSKKILLIETHCPASLHFKHTVNRENNVITCHIYSYGWMCSTFHKKNVTYRTWYSLNREKKMVGPTTSEITKLQLSLLSREQVCYIAKLLSQSRRQ